MGSSDSAKLWERAWSTDEMRQHSTNWSLAGDAGLLKHLQEFSQNLLQQTHTTEVAVDSVMGEMKAAATEVNNVTNMFLMLSNTQFVENRVYDDEEKETPPEDKKVDVKTKSKEEHEAEVVAKVKEALSVGMSVLDTMFDQVEMIASDSEDEESPVSPEPILEPKNPYLLRPLPYLIGSKEFMDDDKVGLADTPSEEESKLVESSASDSENEEEQLVLKQPMAKIAVLSSASETENSETESEITSRYAKEKARSGSKISKHSRLISDTESDGGDMFGKESPRDECSDSDLPASKSIPNSFAAELAAKLGGVTKEGSDEQDGESRRKVSNVENSQAKVKSKQSRKLSSDDFFGVPKEEEEDNIFGQSDGMFSGGRGLFDDLEDEAADHDGLFSKGSGNTKRSDKESERKKVINDKHEGVKTKKAPPGGVSIFPKNSDDLFGDADEDIFSGIIAKKSNKPGIKEKEKNSSVGSFTSHAGTEKSRDIFADDEETEGDLFTESKNQRNKDIVKKDRQASLFKDSTEEESLFPDTDSRAIKIEETKTVGDTVINTDTPKKKMPAGAVSIFGKVDLFKGISPFVRRVSESDESRGDDSADWEDAASSPQNTGISTSVKESTPTSAVETPVKKREVSPNQHALPSAAASKSKKICLFDSEGEEDSLFEPVASNKNKPMVKNFEPQVKPQLKIEREEDIFEKSPDKQLFGTMKPKDSSSSQVDIFSNTPNVAENERNSKPPHKSQVLSLFDDSDSGDELFSSASSTSSKSSKSKSQASIDILSKREPEKTQKTFKSRGLFDDDDVLFGGPQQDVPDIDIFGAKNEDSSNTSGKGSKEATKPAEQNSKHKTTSTSSVDIFADSENNLFPQKSASVVNIVRKTEISSVPKVSRSSHSLFGNVNDGESLFSDTGKNDMSSSSSINKKDSLFDTSATVEIFSNTPEKKARTMKNDENNSSRSIAEPSKPPKISQKPEPPRTLNIRKTTDLFGSVKNEDDDLFAISKKVQTDVQVQNDEESVNSITTSVKSGKNEPKPLSSVENHTPHLPVKTDTISVVENMVTRIEDSKTDVLNDKESPVSSPTRRSPLKSPLQLGKDLNINPLALLPGAKPPLLGEREAAVSFDEPVSVNTLHSAGKERAKIQTRRRPPTRKGRQEALRTSRIDYGESQETGVVIKQDKMEPTSRKKEDKVPSELPVQDVLSTVTENPSIQSGERLPSSQVSPGLTLFPGSNPLSPSTDEEDVFDVPNVHETGDETGCSDLFPGAPVLSPTTNIFDDNSKNSSTLFSDLESEDNLFSGSEKKLDLPPVLEQNQDMFIPRTKKDENRNNPGKDDIFTPPHGSNDLFGDMEPANNLFSSQVQSSVVNRQSSSMKSSFSGSIFDDSPESEDLFSSGKKSAVQTTQRATGRRTGGFESKKDLFSDESGDDSLFGDQSSVKPAQPVLGKTTAKSVLLDDDTDDLFGSSSEAKKPHSKPRQVKPTPAVRTTRNASEDLFEDPLNVIRK